MDNTLIEQLRERAIEDDIEIRDGALMLNTATELERLTAIVEKLPKTADGVPVVPASIVHHADGYFVATGSVGDTIAGVYKSRCYKFSECYSTEAAALATLAAKESSK